jgi:meiotically up-regulated gene 157 (Mug157) protein
MHAAQIALAPYRNAFERRDHANRGIAEDKVNQSTILRELHMQMNAEAWILYFQNVAMLFHPTGYLKPQS